MTSPDPHPGFIRTRAQLQAQETATLAPYAQRSADSAGRKYPEPPHPYRTEYQRDRARIIHSRSFRRLEHKTQVFLSGAGHNLRTRLTHTIEVASISRSIARALALNEDLAEAIALAHDLGHPPFGHSGESTLNRLMRHHGGFDHNLQSLRIVQLIETKYPAFPGLNLSFEVLEGLHKHTPPPPSKKKSGAPPIHNPSLEAQIANLADEITYYSHDLDDGLDSGLITPAQLAHLDVWRHSFNEVRHHFPTLTGARLNGYVIRCIIDRQVQDVISHSAAAIAASRIRTVADVRHRRARLIAYSPPLRAANRTLRKFLYANLYYHPAVALINRRACRALSSLFRATIANPSLLAVPRRPRESFPRALCDHLSAMTDSQLLAEHSRLLSPAS
jgi:dGTPase